MPRHFRLTAIVTVLPVVLLFVTACGPDALLDPERTGDAFATMVTPGVDVSGALLTLTGVDEVILTDGEVIERRVGGELRVVILLDSPGELDFGVRASSGVSNLDGNVLDVIGADDRPIVSLRGFRLEFSR